MKVKGQIDRYLFKSPENDYKIAKITTEDGNSLTIVGYFPLLTENMEYVFTGESVIHKKFGEQLRVTSFKKSENMSRFSVIAYLSGPDFKGVGETIAGRIYDSLGPFCLKTIKDDPNSLSVIKGLSKNKWEDIANALKRKEASEDIFIELYNFGLTMRMASKLFEKYGYKTLETIKSNPYRLLFELDGFGFLKTDALAKEMGITSHDKNRLEQGLIFSLTDYCKSNGYTFLTTEQLFNATTDVLNKSRSDLVDSSELLDALSLLIKKELIVKEEDRIYPKDLYYSEVSFSDKLKEINSFSNSDYENGTILSALSKVEKVLGITYTRKQKEALIETANSKISIITGGPGTGKTTLILGIIHLYCTLHDISFGSEKLYSDLVLCAPTGRASKRMSEQTSFPASTIHKTLGYTFESEFSFNEDNHLPANFIIIDEFSMVDISLASSLLKAIKPGAKVIFVGDVNQLPSVSPGNVLHDIIESKTITTVKLVEVMRQAKDSPIIELSTEINEEHIDKNLFIGNKSLYFYPMKSQEVISGIEKILKNFVLKGGDLINDIIVLAPMYKGVSGIDAINKMVQNKFNNSENKITRNGKLFKLHDKVLQLKNEPEKDIMNGDIGEIIEIKKTDEETIIRINFDGNIVNYGTDFSNLTLAYAISIHKSQGSEFKNVIMPVLYSYYYMLQKKIIYTGATRAKEKLIMLGEYSSLTSSLHKTSDVRQTSLYRRLTGMIRKKANNIQENNSNLKKINDPSIPFDTLGEKNMEGITPYTFMDENPDIF